MKTIIDKHTGQRCPFSEQGAAFNPFGDAYIQDPPEYLRWAREQQPVFYSPEMGYWVVTRYADIKSVFRDHRNFSPANALEKITPSNDAVQAVLDSYDYAMNRTLVNEDEPAHTARRRLLMQPFTPDAVRVHEPMVRRLTREYVDRFIDDGRADLVNQLLWEVPLTIALHFLGVDEDDMPLLRRYSIAHTVNTWGRPELDEQIRVAHAVGNFWRYSGEILDKMRADPSGEGWMKFGIRMQQTHPDVVTDSYLHSMMMAGLVAAHETTANASANAMRLLLQNRETWQQICEDPSLIANAVEECLRMSGSIIAWRRIALNDVRVGGTDLPKGSRVFMVMTSGNHDESQFGDADLLDIRRENAAEHLSFGYGAHQCLGKNLARMEMQVFIEELSTRLPHLKLADQSFEYLRNIAFRGPEHLWVEWDPAGNPERGEPAILERRQSVVVGQSLRSTTGQLLTVKARRQLTDTIVEYELSSPDDQPLARWQPGAHIDVECGDTGLSRSFSLCGEPETQMTWRIAVLREQHSRGGSAWLHQSLFPGQTLKVRGPRNHFLFEPTVRNLVFIAGGIGITPIMAMAAEAKQRGLDYQLHYSGHCREHMAYIEQLQAVHGQRVQLHISSENGRADYRLLLQALQAETDVYVCGPETLIASVELACAGWPQDRVHSERFVSKARLDPAHEKPFDVELRDSGLNITVGPGTTLIEALRSVNIDIPSDCMEGLCGSCEVAVHEGLIDHRDAVLTRAERQSNTRMMACCSRALSSKLVLDV